MCIWFAGLQSRNVTFLHGSSARGTLLVACCVLLVVFVFGFVFVLFVCWFSVCLLVCCPASLCFVVVVFLGPGVLSSTRGETCSGGAARCALGVF